MFDQFAVCGSVRATWLWLRDNDLRWPLQHVGYRRERLPEITWVAPTYHAVHTTLTHPAYAGAYVFGRTRQQRYVADDGQLRVRERRLPQDEWEVLITDHHPGFIDWQTYQTNQDRIGGNIRPQPHQPGTGAVREGAALLQGLATCGTCGRKLAVFYRGPTKSTPGYYCNGTVNWSTARESGTSTSVDKPSTPPSPRPSSLRCPRRRYRPAWPRPSSSRPATTPPWTSTAAKSNKPATPR